MKVTITFNSATNSEKNMSKNSYQKQYLPFMEHASTVVDTWKSQNRKTNQKQNFLKVHEKWIDENH